MSDDMERVAIRTYVPRYQRDIWDEAAESLDMSRSEFVRTMVQAGRRGFSLASSLSADPGATGEIDEDELERRVLELLEERNPRDWAELLEVLPGDIEGRLRIVLNSLQCANLVGHSGGDGYVLLDDGDA